MQSTFLRVADIHPGAGAKMRRTSQDLHIRGVIIELGVARRCRISCHPRILPRDPREWLQASRGLIDDSLPANLRLEDLLEAVLDLLVSLFEVLVGEGPVVGLV